MSATAEHITSKGAKVRTPEAQNEPAESKTEGSIEGALALCRWEDDGGAVTPSKHRIVTEKNGLPYDSHDPSKKKESGRPLPLSGALTACEKRLCLALQLGGEPLLDLSGRRLRLAVDHLGDDLVHQECRDVPEVPVRKASHSE